MRKVEKSILFLDNHLQYSDGVAKAMLELANALDDAGFDVTVMSVFHRDKEFCKQFNPSVNVKTMFGFYFRGFSDIMKPFSTVLYKRFINKKYDIEVAFQYGISTNIIAKSTDTHAKNLAWVHGYEERQLKLHESFDRIVHCSKEGAERYKKVFAYPERVTYLYNLIDDNKLAIMAKEEIDCQTNGKFTFCSVGRLSPEKGFMRLIKCHERLVNEGILHNLWIVGGGAQHEELKKYVVDHSLADSVKLLGADINPYKYMARCDMFVCSSYREGFSTVCVEAALLGKAIVTTEVGGAKEFVGDNNIGIVTKNNDDALYEGMKYVLENKTCIKEYEKNIAKTENLKYVDRVETARRFFSGL